MKSEKPNKVKDFFEKKKDALGLQVIGGGEGLNREIHRAVIQRPSFLLTGYAEDFADKRIQIMGKTEMRYLEKLPKKRILEVVSLLFSYNQLPAVIISKPDESDDFTRTISIMEKIADEKKVPLIMSTCSTEELFTQVTIYLDILLAPEQSIHASMVDVYGVGMLYTGAAGIGKSECALALVERGHRLVADDIVMISKRAGEVLLACGVEGAGHFLEIRGVGIVDIEKLFGIGAIRLQKRVEIEVHLELWKRGKNYERIGENPPKTQYFGVEIPKHTIPVSPGKNITAISEVIAMNHMLRVYGYNSAREFFNRTQEGQRRLEITEEYLATDRE